MPRIGVKGLVNSGKNFVGNVEVPSIPVLDYLFAQIDNAMNGQLDGSNIAAKGVGAASLADLAVTKDKVALGTLTANQMADGIGQTASGSYTGDGVTVDRVIAMADAQALSFTPRYLLVVRTDATFIEFVSIQNGGVTTNWYRDSTGAMAALTANWQGIVTNGFKLGTNAAGTANAAAVVYRWVAFK